MITPTIDRQKLLQGSAYCLFIFGGWAEPLLAAEPELVEPEPEPAPRRAGDTECSRLLVEDLIQRGDDARERGRHRDAIVAYREAFACLTPADRGAESGLLLVRLATDAYFDLRQEESRDDSEVIKGLLVTLDDLSRAWVANHPEDLADEVTDEFLDLKTQLERLMPLPAETPPQPDRAALLHRQGRDKLRLGDPPAAVTLLEEAYDLAKNDEWRFDLAGAYRSWFEQDGDTDHLREARFHARRYREHLIKSEKATSEVDQFLDEIDDLLRPIEPVEEDKPLPSASERSSSVDALNDGTVRPPPPSKVHPLRGWGIALSVLGGLSLGAGASALGTRFGYKAMLDNTTDTHSGTLQYDHWRRGYLIAGQAAFATLNSAAVLLPTGIALLAVAKRRTKGRPSGDRSRARSKLSVTPTIGALKLHF